ncbi:aldehyde dehydrogenase (NADP(+)) [Variovorax saccharolyticus]|uniref:aldehyde dehydrogenase (NADP(+)) n=1 Tax=Variovorax saccharolyticus TaxID=3053516 RepID=UPI002575162C|nr:aldehyde dehydrogenase (NADP(+)) [Variovorax sp. J31P216]MDM0028848.1 aldehyde dehydrogenase (NADP(+)) [Variovorax sp. J31P216]
MNLTGTLIIGAIDVIGTEGSLRALDPDTGHEIDPPFSLGGIAEVDRAARLADEAFESYSQTTPSLRAAFLERIAANLDALRSELALRASMETGLPAASLELEALKTATQLRQFAQVVRSGDFQRVAIDPAQPERLPRPRMDHRMHKVALGPVAIFGASNFPILYSVVGGDTASALAAGCPVILKAHNAHPGASELEARAVRDAVCESGFHEGVFSLLRGAGNEIGEALVTHPLVKAVTFTGSQGGGMALFRAAQSREEPIPVFAEMTSVNPTFLLPGAVAGRGAEIGAGFIERMLVNVGQACLKPAIAIAVDGQGLAGLREAMTKMVVATEARTMLTPGIFRAYSAGLTRMRDHGARRIAEGKAPTGQWHGQACLFETSGSTFLTQPALSEEVFGPSALLVVVASVDEMVRVARSLRGQLTATIHLDNSDSPTASRLIPILERRTGRLIANAFSHPQEVSHAAIHTGPFPATTDSRFTSVGMTSIDRFLRPVCYQGFPEALLPEALRADNPLKLTRLVDGESACPDSP